MGGSRPAGNKNSADEKKRDSTRMKGGSEPTSDTNFDDGKRRMLRERKEDPRRAQVDWERDSKTIYAESFREVNCTLRAMEL